MAGRVKEVADSVIISNMIFMADMAQKGASKSDRDLYLNYAVGLMKKMVREKAAEKYRHIIFDLDGTLLDTEEAVLKTWQHTLQDYGYEFSLEELKTVLGITPESALKKLKITEYKDFWPRWLENHFQYVKEITFFDGITEMLQSLKRHGYSLGIVTSRTREEYNCYFRSFQLEDLFDIMILADDTKRHKPDPEPLYKYGELAGVPLRDCIYVGDMPTDIECANRAGVTSALAVWNGSQSLCREAKLLFRSPKELRDILDGEDSSVTGITPIGTSKT